VYENVSHNSNVFLEEGPVSSETRRSLMTLKNIIVTIMTNACICWLNLWKLDVLRGMEKVKFAQYNNDKILEEDQMVYVLREE
jgi:hypothetical protein